MYCKQNVSVYALLEIWQLAKSVKFVFMAGDKSPPPPPPPPLKDPSPSPYPHPHTLHFPFPGNVCTPLPSWFWSSKIICSPLHPPPPTPHLPPTPPQHTKSHLTVGEPARLNGHGADGQGASRTGHYLVSSSFNTRAGGVLFRNDSRLSSSSSTWSQANANWPLLISHITQITTGMGCSLHTKRGTRADTVKPQLPLSSSKSVYISYKLPISLCSGLPDRANCHKSQPAFFVQRFVKLDRYLSFCIT